MHIGRRIIWAWGKFVIAGMWLVFGLIALSGGIENSAHPPAIAFATAAVLACLVGAWRYLRSGVVRGADGVIVRAAGRRRRIPSTAAVTLVGSATPLGGLSTLVPTYVDEQGKSRQILCLALYGWTQHSRRKAERAVETINRWLAEGVATDASG